MSKVLYELKDFREHYFFERDEEENLSIIEKELKALEIIKNKNVLPCMLKDELEKYNKCCPKNEELTQEEYDLLKEVLK